MASGIKKYSTIDQVNEALAEWLMNDINRVLKTQNRYTMALSGGSTPKGLYELLAQEYSERIPWQQVHIFLDDERYVPLTDERSNGAMIMDALTSKVSIPAAQVHLVPTGVPPAQSALEYEAVLQRYFVGRHTTFNLVLLGMGADGHTLSLFPNTAVVHEQQQWVKEVLLADGETYRITLTAPVVNRAETIIFLVTGSSKAQTLQQVMGQPFQPDVLPAQLIKPVSGNLLWFVDNAAAASL